MATKRGCRRRGKAAPRTRGGKCGKRVRKGRSHGRKHRRHRR